MYCSSNIPSNDFKEALKLLNNCILHIFHLQGFESPQANQNGILQFIIFLNQTQIGREPPFPRKQQLVAQNPLRSSMEIDSVDEMLQSFACINTN